MESIKVDIHGHFLNMDETKHKYLSESDEISKTSRLLEALMDK